MDKNTLVNYFANSWQSNIEKYKYSGPALIEKIGQDASVLDIGCGFHYFKDKFTTIYGIDIANPAADQVVDVLEYKPYKKFDAILCLGSINFGSADTVFNQCKYIVDTLLKSGGTIYWRCNPGLHDHKWDGMEEIDFFPWTMDLHKTWSELLNCKLSICTWDTDDRIYAEWIKN